MDDWKYIILAILIVILFFVFKYAFWSSILSAVIP